MTYTFASWTCEFCGLHRKLHNELQKKQCSDARKKSYEDAKRPRRNKPQPYSDAIIKHLADT